MTFQDLFTCMFQDFPQPFMSIFRVFPVPLMEWMSNKSGRYTDMLINHLLYVTCFK